MKTKKIEEKTCALCSLSQKISTSKFIPYRKFLLLVPIILLCFAVILTSLFGLNNSFDFQDKYVFYVDYKSDISDKDYDKYICEIKNIVKNEGFGTISFEETGETIYTKVVVKVYSDISQEDMETKFATIKENIEEKYSEMVIEVSEVSIQYHNLGNVIQKSLVALLIFVIAGFIYILIRFDITTAITGIAITIYSILLNFIIYGLFRMPFSNVSIATFFITIVVSHIIYVLISDNIREEKMKEQKNRTNEDFVYTAVQSISPVIFLIWIILFVISLVATILLFILGSAIAFELLSVAISLTLALYIAIFAIPSLWAGIYHKEKDNKLKARIEKAKVKEENKKNKTKSKTDEKIVI